jgi:hypothetical protein
MQSYGEKHKYINFATDGNAKYRKKKQSNSSKAKARSDHKHIKKECLLICSSNHQVYYSNYCTICGKIIDWQVPMVKEDSGRFGVMYRELSNEEILEKYKNLEVKEITDIFNKYVSV